MSVLLEFTLASEDFALGRALAGTPSMHLELERIVPTGTQVTPFVWVTGDDHDAFERRLRKEPIVSELAVLDRTDESTLYRIDWSEPPGDLVDGIGRSAGTVLEASGNGEWLFRLRFPDNESLSAFHSYCADADLPIQIERTHPFEASAKDNDQFDLTAEQREALVLALRRGYFATPREVSLDELAADLDISRQALSKRIRLGNEKLIESVLQSPGAD